MVNPSFFFLIFQITRYFFLLIPQNTNQISTMDPLNGKLNHFIYMLQNPKIETKKYLQKLYIIVQSIHWNLK